MICRKCNSVGELKVFQSFSYYFCPDCKDEIMAVPPPEPKTESTTDWTVAWDSKTGFPYAKAVQNKKSPWTTYCDECQVDTAIIDHYPTCTQHPKWVDPNQLSFDFDASATPDGSVTINPTVKLAYDAKPGERRWFKRMRELGEEIAKKGAPDVRRK